MSRGQRTEDRGRRTEDSQGRNIEYGYIRFLQAYRTGNNELRILKFVTHLLGFCGLLENLFFFVREGVLAVVVNFFQNAVKL